MSTKGMVYLFTGDGKGKTSAALGVAMRAVAVGKKVGWVSWYKEKAWPISEKKLPKLLKGTKGSLEMYWLGEGFYKLPTDKATPEQHKKVAKEALEKAARLMKKVDVLVLDEVNKAVEDRLIELIKVIELLAKRGETHVILTGRGGGLLLGGQADLVTEMKKIKHPFDRGIKAIRGLDY